MLRHVAIDTCRENVAYLHRDCPIYRSEGFQALSRIEIHKAGNGPRVIAMLNVMDHPAITGLDELGLSEQAFRQSANSYHSLADTMVAHDNRPATALFKELTLSAEVYTASF